MQESVRRTVGRLVRNGAKYSSEIHRGRYYICLRLRTREGLQALQRIQCLQRINELFM